MLGCLRKAMLRRQKRRLFARRRRWVAALRGVGLAAVAAVLPALLHGLAALHVDRVAIDLGLEPSQMSRDGS
jgi:hypothetical protein